jgi:arsenite methyltransferase
MVFCRKPMNAQHAKSTLSEEKINYGIDAPAFQRRALFGGFAAVVVGFLLTLFQSKGDLPPVFQYAGVLVWPGAWFFLTGCVMYWGSKIGKLHLRDKIIASIAWRGDGRVLDIGCGHGLMLLAAAKRLTTDRAIGIDVWSQVDQADNNPESTMENAQLEKVLDRIELTSADARKIPFPDNSFDVILSSFAIHNLEHAQDRVQVMQEIARVLRPGGQLASRTFATLTSTNACCGRLAGPKSNDGFRIFFLSSQLAC